MNNAYRAEQHTNVYSFYTQGYTAKEIAKATGYEQEEVQELVWRWRVLEAREKKFKEDQQYAKFSSNNIIIPKRNEGVSDFVLLTNNPEVEEAYARLVNPLKVNPIP